MASARKMVFGSSTTVISLAAALANGANTYNGLSGLTQTQLDNSTLLYPHALAVLSIPDTFSAAPTPGSSIDLYMSLDDVDGTTDETPLPATGDILYNAKYVDSFILDNQDVATVKALIISLHGVQKAQFYIDNKSGATASYASSPITVKITPFSYEPT